MSGRDSASPHYQVICVCGGYGFPQGDASAARITIIGRALQAAGIGFRLLHCGPSPFAANTRRAGVHEGISFEYTTLLRRPANQIARLLVYLWGAVGLTVQLGRLWSVRRRTVVHLYVMRGPLNLYVGCLCRILGLPLVQELCEWWPGDLSNEDTRRCQVTTCSTFTRWLYSNSMFKLATGVVAISNTIEERVKERAVEVNPHLLIHRLPNIVDTERFATASFTKSSLDQSVPHFVYCGTWMVDVLFILRAFALLRHSGYRARLTIIGRYAEAQSTIVLEYARERGLLPDDLVLAGYVDDRTLEACYKTAAALLMPLRQDDRSLTRLPNKMGEYLASGRPVVTCAIGDLTNFLIDNVNAYLGEPGNERDFADKMVAVLEHPDRAEQIGAAGQRVALAHLDYRGHVNQLARFFVNCIEPGKQRRYKPTPIGKRGRAIRESRNCLCGLLALGIIASGRVRRAKKRALSGEVVTAIYFHKPNKRLFGQCVHWLTKSGYHFISASDLLDILYRGQAPPKGAVWLSFDDGCKELLEDVISPILLQKIPVTLFIPAGIIQGDGRFPWLHKKTPVKLPSAPRDSLTVDELIQVASYPPVAVGCHTMSHALTCDLTEDEARFELGESKRTLESWTGSEVKYFAYPEGRFDHRERLLLKEFGYALAATTKNAFVAPETDPYLLPRFSVADDIYFPEAICNMVGAWRPVIDSILGFLGNLRRILKPWRRFRETEGLHKNDDPPELQRLTGLLTYFLNRLKRLRTKTKITRLKR